MKVAPLFLLPFVVSVLGCSSACENNVLSEAASPSGRLKAVAFNRSCGATTGFNVQVSIQQNGSKLKADEGNALVTDGADLASLAWMGENSVEVKFSKKPRVFKLNPVDGVRVVTSASL